MTVGDVKAAGADAQVNGRREREHRAGEREQEELAGRVAPFRAAPDADDEEHRDQRQLKEDVEQQHVPRDEHAEHGHEQRQHPRVVFRLALLDDVEARRDRERRQPDRQQDQPDADRVDVEVKAEVVERRDAAAHELQRLPHVKPDRDPDPDQERRQADVKRPRLDALPVQQERADDRADHRDD